MMLETQTSCAVCFRSFEELDEKQIHIDHDHKTGAIRRLLCFNCNGGLGNFKDSIERLEQAIVYLKEFSCAS
jgi:hypothetical protein